MPHFARRAASPVLFLAMVASLPASAIAGSDWTDMLRGVPPEANALGLVDVAFLREQVQAKQGSAPILDAVKWVVSDDIFRGAFVAQMDVAKIEPVWEIGVFGTSKVVTAEKLAKFSKGYVDEVGGLKLVCTPKDSYLGAIGTDTALAYKPANRSAIARVLKGRSAAGEPPLSPFLKDVVAEGTTKAPVVLALDLTDVISPRAVKAKVANLASVAGTTLKVDDVANLLGDLKGVVFTASAEGKGKGSLRIVFGGSPDLLTPVAKPMVLEILGRAGAGLPDAEGWTASVLPTSILLEGRLSPQTLSHVLGLFSTPFAMGSAQTTASADVEGESSIKSAGAASKRYYASVQRIVEGLRNDKAQTLGQRALWCDREGRKIDHLPILNVDPELLNYGAAVSSLLRGSGLDIRTTNMKAEVEKDKTMAFGGYGYGWGGYSNAAFAQAGTETNNLNVIAQKNLTAQSAYLEAMSKIDQMTASIRRKMTEKYQIEF